MSEALTIELAPVSELSAAHPLETPCWYALWTRSHCEERVREQLAGKGFEVFLPKIDQWSKRGGERRVIRVPMFPGYLFLRRAMDKASYVAVRQARGLVGILGEGWDRLATIPEADVAAVQRLVEVRAPALPYPYLRAGQRVRITSGPLADLEGILVRTKPNRGLLVISVDLLQRSVATHVDCTSVVPV